MIKLTRQSRVFNLLWSVFGEKAPTIGALIFIMTLTGSGALAYMVGEEQPMVFSSIPAAMWWAIETITTVGYGDMVPITAVGKILGGLVSIIGIGTLALFFGVTVGLLDQLRIIREQAQHRTLILTIFTDKEDVAVISGAGAEIERMPDGGRRRAKLVRAAGV